LSFKTWPEAWLKTAVSSNKNDEIAILFMSKK